MHKIWVVLAAVAIAGCGGDADDAVTVADVCAQIDRDVARFDDVDDRSEALQAVGAVRGTEMATDAGISGDAIRDECDESVEQLLALIDVAMNPSGD